ncbi:uncharacterized protein LOC131699580 [Acipenser ruthenus]|uniref:uncharacterized protein LOC131699580 n=1 Tax=Acipenser ruthenus TaxID=7906 RepID=UPI0027406BCB|nr:uncharacterized protein LOC131699580 [Acipenser ruthenus]
MLTVNVYHNGTVMVQGRESSLDLFEHSFPALRERVERAKTIPELANPQPLPPSPAQPSSQHPHPQHSPVTDSPRQVSNIRALKECLSVLELQFTEFREHTEHKLATLSQASPSEQLRDEVHRLKTEHRAEVQELRAAMRGLEEDNQAMKTELRRLREELTRTAQHRELRSLQRELEGLRGSQLRTPAAQEQQSTRRDCTDTHTDNPDTHTQPQPYRQTHRQPQIHTHTTPATQADTQPAPNTHTTPATQADTQTAPNTHTTPATQTDTQTALNTHTTPATQADTKTAPNTHTTPATQADTQTAPNTHTTPATQADTQTAPNTQSEQQGSAEVLILIDSNGRYLDERRLFPGRSVDKIKCPTTQSALQILSKNRQRSPKYIVIHTGTNNLRADRGDVAKSVQQVAETAAREYPSAKVIVSTLLPRADVPFHIIHSINTEVSRGCALLPSVHLAHHHHIRPHHMYDQVHLNREGMKLFAKSLKDIALGRELTSTPYTETRSTPSCPRAPRIPQPPRPRPHHRAASQQEQRLGPPRPPHSLQPPRPRPHHRAANQQERRQGPPRHPHSPQPPQHSYAAAVSRRPGNPTSTELNEIRHLFNLICTKLIS